MAVVEDGSNVVASKVLFVKKSFKEGKDLGTVDDVVLKFNENAFKTFDDALKTVQETDSAAITVLDSSLKIESALSAGVVELRQAKYTDDGKTPYTTKGSLKISADVKANLTLFNAVTVTDAVLNGNVRGGTISKKGVFNSKGSLKLNGSEFIGDVYNLKTVSAVNSIIDGSLNGYQSSLVFKLDKKADAAESKVYSIGAADSKVAVTNFKSVNLAGIKNKSLTKGLSVYADITGTEDKKGRASGTFKASNGVDVNGNIFSFKTVALTNSSVTGTIIGDVELEKIAGSFTFSANKNAAAAEYGIGAISGFKTVKISGYKSKDMAVAAVVNGNIAGGNPAGEGKPNVANGTASFTNGVQIKGDVTGFKSVTLTNSSATGKVVGDEYAEKAAGTFTLKTNKNAVGSEFSVGAVSGFKTVKISGFKNKDVAVSAVVNGDIAGGNYESGDGANRKYSTNGTASFTNGVQVKGAVTGFKTVTMTYASADGVDNLGAKGTSLNMSNALVSGTVAGVQKLNAKKGRNEVTEYIGTDLDDTLTISKNASLTVGDVLDFGNGSKNKLVLNGTLVVKGSWIEEEDVNPEAPAEGGDTTDTPESNPEAGGEGTGEGTGEGKPEDTEKPETPGEEVQPEEETKPVNRFKVTGLNTISGSGEIAADTATLEHVRSQFDLPANSKIKFVDLGATSENFYGTKYEAGDDVEKKAYKWENTSFAYKGWLSNYTPKDIDQSVTSIIDKVDYFKLTAPVEEGAKFKFTAAEGVTLNYGGKDYLNGDEFTMASKDDLFKVTIGDKVESSVAYSVEKIA